MENGKKITHFGVDPRRACEGCVFGGKHAEWCPLATDTTNGPGAAKKDK